MELENKYILISNFCVVLFFFFLPLFLFKKRKITRITFKKMNCWAELTVGLLACKYPYDNLASEGS